VAEKPVARFVSGHRLSPGWRHGLDSLGRVAWPGGVHPGGGQGPRTCSARSGPPQPSLGSCVSGRSGNSTGLATDRRRRGEQLPSLGRCCASVVSLCFAAMACVMRDA
jgi:hypothetical protein